MRLILKSFNSTSRLVELVHCWLRCHHHGAAGVVIVAIGEELCLFDDEDAIVFDEDDIIKWVNKEYNHIYLYACSVIGFDSNTPTLWTVSDAEKALELPYIYPLEHTHTLHTTYTVTD